MKRLRVEDKVSKGRKWAIGVPLSIKDIIEIVESMGFELDEIHTKLEALEKKLEEKDQ